MGMAERMTRRQWIHLSAGTLLALGMWPGRLGANDLRNAGDFTFLVVNDLHFFDEECWSWFEEAVVSMKISARDAEFCLLCGDLTDNGRPDQLFGIRDAFEKLGV